MKRNFETIAHQLIISIAMTMILGGLALLINDEIRGIHWICAIILAIVYSFIKLKGEKRMQQVLVTNLLFLFITFGTFYINHYFYDVSWDGQTYHQEAIIKLQEGWNPIYDQHLDEEIVENIWVNHYAKGNWIYAASIYDLFGDLEIGKSYNALFMIALFILTFLFLLSKIKWYGAFLGASALTLNPIAVNQLLTNYNDGQIGLIMSIIVILLLSGKETTKIQNYRIIGLLVVIMASIKFTALAYVMLIAFAPFVFVLYDALLVKKRSIQQTFMELLTMKELKIFMIALFVGVGIVGANSYVKNTIEHQHPFYPLSGNGKIDIMWYNTPKAIEDKPLYQQFYMSIFGEMTNDRTKEVVAIKFPLAINENEIPYLGAVDLRIGGFGPFFGFIVLFATLLLVAWRHSIFRKENRKELMILSLILVSIVINPETWWARYIPQMWLMPLLIVWMILKEKTKTKSIVLVIMTVVMIMNSGVMMKASLEKNIADTAIRNEQLTMIKQYAKKNEITIQYDTKRSNRIMFESIKNIKKEEIQVEKFCANNIRLQSTTTRICIPNEADYKELVEKNQAIVEKYKKEEFK